MSLNLIHVNGLNDVLKEFRGLNFIMICELKIKIGGTYSPRRTSNENLPSKGLNNKNKNKILGIRKAKFFITVCSSKIPDSH